MVSETVKVEVIDPYVLSFEELTEIADKLVSYYAPSKSFHARLHLVRCVRGMIECHRVALPVWLYDIIKD